MEMREDKENCKDAERVTTITQKEDRKKGNEMRKLEGNCEEEPKKDEKVNMEEMEMRENYWNYNEAVTTITQRPQPAFREGDQRGLYCQTC